MEASKIDKFITDYMAFYNSFLNLSAKETDDALQRIKDDGFFGNKEESLDFKKISGSGLVFFNPKSGVEIALNVNSAFPSKSNPFFNPDESEDHIMRLILSKELSTELVLYCVDNFKKELEFFKSFEGELFLENLDFLLRFFKGENYYSKPSVTLTGKAN